MKTPGRSPRIYPLESAQRIVTLMPYVGTRARVEHRPRRRGDLERVYRGTVVAVAVNASGGADVLVLDATSTGGDVWAIPVTEIAYVESV